MIILPTAFCCSYAPGALEGYQIINPFADRSLSNIKVKLDETDILGFIKEIDFKYYFVSQKPWKYFKVRLDLNRCQYLANLTANERVLFRSNKNEDELLKIAKNNQGTNGWALSSKNLSLFAEAVANREEYPAGHPNMFWKYCSEDSSCKKIIVNCNEQVGVNIKYEEKYKDYFKKQKNVNCGLINNLSNKKRSKCVQNFCS